MNPLNWRREHQVAFVFTALFGACIGILAGMGHFDPYTNFHWPEVGLWGIGGAVLGAVGGFLRQLLRNPFSN
jgi:uncharacterized membrane protein YfcA